MKLKVYAFLFLWTSLLACSSPENPPGVPSEKPNILLIAIDDLNDWIGVLGGHPQAQTPNIDRLAARGLTFTNAHCQSPVCNPSRASMMTSLYPATTGIYFLNPPIEASEVALRNKVMPRRFSEEGYYVTAAGKLFHNAYQQNETYIPNYGGSFGGFGPLPEEKLSPYPGLYLWDWGVYPAQEADMPDHQIAEWAVNQLETKRDTPLWMGVGFYRPHVPQYAPQKWFDLYPLDSIELPAYLADDLTDISEYGKNITRLEHVHPDFGWVVKNDQWKPLVQSYLACVSFVDEQVGKVLEALEKSAYAENTFMVLYSDHGFHLGQKDRFAKRSLWEDGTRIPLIIAGPGIPQGEKRNQPVQLLDIYPTLLALAGLEADSLHEGRSLIPLLQKSDVDWPYYARTSFGPGNYAIISEQFRYIHYQDGTEEFYDRSNDLYEWHNLIQREDYAILIDQHRAQLPEREHPILGEGSTGHKSYAASEALLH